MTAPNTLNGFPVLMARRRSAIDDPTWTVLVDRGAASAQRYVVAAWSAECRNEWVWGDYFADLDKATEAAFAKSHTGQTATTNRHGWTATAWTVKRLEAARASVIGTAQGYTFYEDPERGDEAPLLAIWTRSAAPTVWNTGEYDLPDYL